MTTPQPNQSLVNGISNWYRMNSLIVSAKNAYHKDVNSIYVCMSQGSLSPANALWRFQTQALPIATQYFEYDGAIEAVAMGIANILRETITDAQSNFNSLVQKIEQGVGGVTFANGLKSALQQLQADLKVSVDVDGKSKGLTYILGGGVIKNISQFVQNLLNPLSKPHTVVCYSLKTTTITYHLHTQVQSASGKHVDTKNYSWNLTVQETTKVTKSTDIVTEGFYTYFKSVYNNAVSNGMPVSQIFSTFTSNFNNLNESVSGISSAIQAQMQYLNSNLQEYLGVYKNFFDDYANLSTYIVNKQKSN